MVKIHHKASLEGLNKIINKIIYWDMYTGIKITSYLVGFIKGWGIT